MKRIETGQSKPERERQRAVGGSQMSEAWRFVPLALSILVAGCGGEEFLGQPQAAAGDALGGAAGGDPSGPAQPFGGNASGAGGRSEGSGASAEAGSSLGGSAGATGGEPMGGEATGGNSAGGNSTGGNSTGGNSAGGNSTGGNSTGGNSTGGNGPASECPCAAPKPTCLAGKCVVRGPVMVKAGPIYIDSTEVTVGQYAAFLTAKAGNVSGQAPQCSWNDSFLPAGASPPGSHPVTGVDFCDAAAFCAWADKRLCGQLGGGKLSLNDVPVASKCEWFSACGGPQGQPFPYGSTHIDGACNDATGAGAIAPVGSFPGCTGVYPGLYDMVGNVAEWIDACDATNNGWDGCETIGGASTDTLPCSGSGLRHRDQREPFLGFRCCGK